MIFIGKEIEILQGIYEYIESEMSVSEYKSFLIDRFVYERYVEFIEAMERLNVTSQESYRIKFDREKFHDIIQNLGKDKPNFLVYKL